MSIISKAILGIIDAGRDCGPEHFRPLPYDALNDEYRQDPAAACRKALRLTRRIRNVDFRMRSMDKLLGMHGAETIHDRHGHCVLEYLNTGDSYALTVCLFPNSGTFRVMSWGDFVERNDKRLGI